MSDSYAHALADVRSSLAALADQSQYDPSIAYEHVLLDLDAMHGGLFPSTYPTTGTPAHLHRRAEARLDALVHHGADPLAIELICARLDDIARSHSRDPPHQRPHTRSHSFERSAHSTSTQWPVRACRETDGHASRWTVANSSCSVVDRRALHRRRRRHP
jgi:hypothetical protein